MDKNHSPEFTSAVNECDGKEMLNLLMIDDNIPAGAKMY